MNPLLLILLLLLPWIVLLLSWLVRRRLRGLTEMTQRYCACGSSLTPNEVAEGICYFCVTRKRVESGMSFEQATHPPLLGPELALPARLKKCANCQWVIQGGMRCSNCGVLAPGATTPRRLFDNGSNKCVICGRTACPDAAACLLYLRAELAKEPASAALTCETAPPGRWRR